MIVDIGGNIMKILIWIGCLIGFIISIIILNYLLIDIVVSTGFPIIGLFIFIIPFAIFLWHKIVKKIDNKRIITISLIICIIIFIIYASIQIIGFNYIKKL
jgi:hypothetical protein